MRVREVYVPGRKTSYLLRSAIGHNHVHVYIYTYINIYMNTTQHPLLYFLQSDALPQ